MKSSIVYSLIGYTGLAVAVNSIAGGIMYYRALEEQQNETQPQVELPVSMRNHMFVSGFIGLAFSGYGFSKASQEKKEEQKIGLENKLNKKGEQ